MTDVTLHAAACLSLEGLLQLKDEVIGSQLKKKQVLSDENLLQSLVDLCAPSYLSQDENAGDRERMRLEATAIVGSLCHLRRLDTLTSLFNCRVLDNLLPALSRPSFPSSQVARHSPFTPPLPTTPKQQADHKLLETTLQTLRNLSSLIQAYCREGDDGEEFLGDHDFDEMEDKQADDEEEAEDEEEDEDYFDLDDEWGIREAVGGYIWQFLEDDVVALLTSFVPTIPIPSSISDSEPSPDSAQPLRKKQRRTALPPPPAPLPKASRKSLGMVLDLLASVVNTPVQRQSVLGSGHSLFVYEEKDKRRLTMEQMEVIVFGEEAMRERDKRNGRKGRRYEGGNEGAKENTVCFLERLLGIMQEGVLDDKTAASALNLFAELQPSIHPFSTSSPSSSSPKPSTLTAASSQFYGNLLTIPILLAKRFLNSANPTFQLAGARFLSLDSPCLPIHFPPTLHQAIHDFNLVRYELAQVGLITLIAINASGALHTRSEETTVFMKACFILARSIRSHPLSPESVTSLLQIYLAPLLSSFSREAVKRASPLPPSSVRSMLTYKEGQVKEPSTIDGDLFDVDPIRRAHILEAILTLLTPILLSSPETTTASSAISHTFPNLLTPTLLAQTILPSSSSYPNTFHARSAAAATQVLLALTRSPALLQTDLAESGLGEAVIQAILHYIQERKDDRRWDPDPIRKVYHKRKGTKETVLIGLLGCLANLTLYFSPLREHIADHPTLLPHLIVLFRFSNPSMEVRTRIMFFFRNYMYHAGMASKRSFLLLDPSFSHVLGSGTFKSLHLHTQTLSLIWNLLNSLATPSPLSSPIKKPVDRAASETAEVLRLFETTAPELVAVLRRNDPYDQPDSTAGLDDRATWEVSVLTSSIIYVLWSTVYSKSEMQSFPGSIKSYWHERAVHPDPRLRTLAGKALESGSVLWPGKSRAEDAGGSSK